MNISDIIVTAESVKTGEQLIGYVCGCKSCRTAFENEKYDHNRSIGLLTHPDEKYGNVRVYTDNMELYNLNEDK
jgi:hypothetical protein